MEVRGGKVSCQLNPSHVLTSSLFNIPFNFIFFFSSSLTVARVMPKNASKSDRSNNICTEILWVATSCKADGRSSSFLRNVGINLCKYTISNFTLLLQTGACPQKGKGGLSGRECLMKLSSSQLDAWKSPLVGWP